MCIAALARISMHPCKRPLRCRATAALVNSVLGGNKDVEMAGSALFQPVWVQKSEKIRVDLTLLKDRLNKLKEWVHASALDTSIPEFHRHMRAFVDASSL